MCFLKIFKVFTRFATCAIMRKFWKIFHNFRQFVSDVKRTRLDIYKWKRSTQKANERLRGYLLFANLVRGSYDYCYILPKWAGGLFLFLPGTTKQGQIVCKKVPFFEIFIFTRDPCWSPVAKFSTGDILGGFYLLPGWTPPDHLDRTYCCCRLKEARFILRCCVLFGQRCCACTSL